MTNEIKEILDYLRYTAKKHTIQVLENGGKIEHCPQEVATEMRLNTYSANILLDYITNLQEEIKGQDVALDSSVKNIKEKQQRIDKAVEYIDEHTIHDTPKKLKNGIYEQGQLIRTCSFYIEDLLDILRGDE